MTGFIHNSMVEGWQVSFIILGWRVDWFHSQFYCGGLAGFILNSMVESWLVSFTILEWRFHSQSYGGGLAGFIHNPRVEGWLVYVYKDILKSKKMCEIIRNAI